MVPKNIACKCGLVIAVAYFRLFLSIVQRGKGCSIRLGKISVRLGRGGRGCYERLARVKTRDHYEKSGMKTFSLCVISDKQRILKNEKPIR